MCWSVSPTTQGRKLRSSRANSSDAARAEVVARAKDFMLGLGRKLYDESAPPAFKKAFWELSRRLGPSFRTIQIYSSDFDLPWEVGMDPVIPNVGERGLLVLSLRLADGISASRYQS